jgi:hypothetical protein
LLKDEVVDVSIVATEILARQGLSLTTQIAAINPVAQLSLVKLEFIGIRRGGACPIARDMQKMCGKKISGVVWKTLFGNHYDHAIRKVARLRACFETDASSWVNLLDTIHDDLLDALFNHDGSIGAYVHGNIGGTVGTKTSRFAKKYPWSRSAFDEIHQTRLKSDLSHSIVYKTGRRTRYIPHAYISKVKPLLIRAYIEISTKW